MPAPLLQGASPGRFYGACAPHLRSCACHVGVTTPPLSDCVLSPLRAVYGLLGGTSASTRNRANPTCLSRKIQLIYFSYAELHFG